MIVKIIRVAFLVNLQSGAGRGKRFYRRVVCWLQKNAEQTNIVGSFFIIDNRNEKSVENYVRTIMNQGCDVLAIIGGDGTIHASVNCLLDYQIPLLVFRAGTANDFAKTLKIPKNPEKVLELLTKGRIEQVDLGKVNGRLFINVFGIGFDAKVIQCVEHLKKKLHFTSNILLYLLALLWVLFFRLEYYYIRMTTTPSRLDDQEMMSTTTSIMVCNVENIGGVLRLAPKATPNDGWLDICHIKHINRLRALWFLYRALRGYHLTLSEVTTESNGELLRARSMVISSLNERVIPCQADGESLPYQKEYHILILPKILSVFVP